MTFYAVISLLAFLFLWDLVPEKPLEITMPLAVAMFAPAAIISVCAVCAYLWSNARLAAHPDEYKRQPKPK